MTKVAFERFTHRRDFNDGMSCNNMELENYRQQIADKLANDKDKDYSSIRTGNMLTFGLKDKTTGEITIFQAEGYVEHKYRVEELEG